MKHATILEAKRSYESAINGARGRLARELPGYRNFTPGAQEVELRGLQTVLRSETESRLRSLLKDAEEERRSIPQKIAALKYPALMKPESRGVGESQLLAAQLFLSTNPSHDRLVGEIRSSLELGRRDYASALIDGTRRGFPAMLTQELQAFDRQLSGLEADPEKLKNLRAEEQQAAISEQLLHEFLSQVESGAEVIVLPELWPFMEEAERKTAWDAQARRNLTELVAMKGRIQQVMPAWSSATAR